MRGMWHAGTKLGFSPSFSFLLHLRNPPCVSIDSLIYTIRIPAAHRMETGKETSDLYLREDL